MSKKNAQPELVPRLRFPEFRDAGEWVRGRCADIADVLQGYGFPERHQGSSKGLYPFYKVSDISASVEEGKKYITRANNYIDEDVLSEIGAKPVPEGTTIFAKIGEAIRSNRRAITTQPSVVDNNVAGVKAISGKACDNFLYYLWSNIYLIDFAGGVVPAISKSAIETIPVAYTDIQDEQQKIAACLGSLDDLIAAEGRKLTGLRDHKKGLMQQLFPREGETQPRLRFREFQDAPEWEEQKLSRHVDLVSGVHLSPDDYGTSGDVPYFTGPSDFTNTIDNISKWTETTGNVASTGDILITVKGSGVGELWHLQLECVALGRQLMAVKAKTGPAQFIFQLLLTKRRRFEELASGNLIPGLSRGDILDLKTPFPREDEQQRIAVCLSSLDAMIAAQAEKLDALRTHKRGLMQQLFPSPEDD